MIDILNGELDYLLQGATGGIGWLLLAMAAVMFGTWAGAYILIIRKCFRERTYGVPMLAVCLNISWEAQMAVNPPDSYPHLLRIGNFTWLIPDLLVLYLVYRFGREAQARPEIRKYFHLVLSATLVLCFFAILTFRSSFADPYGFAAAWILAVIMCVLFILLVFNRPDGRGLSYPAAWLMMLGNIAAAIFCYFWQPMQFEIGRLEAAIEPPSYSFFYLLYGVVPLLHVIYIVQLRRLRARGATV